MHTKMSHYVITVEFDIDPRAEADFMTLMLENAEESVRAEPGCLRFDVLTPAETQTGKRVLLYEIYEDRAAFDEHLASDHFKRFDALTATMVRSKSVRQYAVAQNAKTGN